jgi:hypothetical protein
VQKKRPRETPQKYRDPAVGHVGQARDDLLGRLVEALAFHFFWWGLRSFREILCPVSEKKSFFFRIFFAF